MFAACAGIVLNFLNSPIIAIYCLMAFLLTGMIMRLSAASVIQMYPTNLRAMATNFSMVFARIGGATGAYLNGMYFKKNCELSINGISIALLIVGASTLWLPKKRY